MQDGAIYIALLSEETSWLLEEQLKFQESELWFVKKIK